VIDALGLERSGISGRLPQKDGKKIVLSVSYIPRPLITGIYIMPEYKCPTEVGLLHILSRCYISVSFFVLLPAQHSSSVHLLSCTCKFQSAAARAVGIARTACGFMQHHG
jgi:hypothetical protein